MLIPFVNFPFPHPLSYVPLIIAQYLEKFYKCRLNLHAVTFPSFYFAVIPFSSEASEYRSAPTAFGR